MSQLQYMARFTLKASDYVSTEISMYNMKQSYTCTSKMIAVYTLEITTDLLSIMKKLPNFVYIMMAFFEVYLYKASAKETASY